MAKQGYLKAGDMVQVIRPFYFYDEYYSLNDRFVMREEFVGHGFEKYVVKVEAR